MRVIAGTARGRKLFSPSGNKKKHSIRPTSDRCRESLFSILGSKCLENSLVLDLFSGTGALGIESLSRGARHVVFVDFSSSSIGLIKKNVTLLGFSSYLLLKRDITKGLFFLKKEFGVSRNQTSSSTVSLKGCYGFDLVFLDPPYQKNYSTQVLTDLSGNGLLSSGGIVVCEEHKSCSFSEKVGSLTLFDNRIYGDTGFWFYSNTC